MWMRADDRGKRKSFVGDLQKCEAGKYIIEPPAMRVFRLEIDQTGGNKG